MCQGFCVNNRKPRQPGVFGSRALVIARCPDSAWTMLIESGNPQERKRALTVSSLPAARLVEAASTEGIGRSCRVCCVEGAESTLGLPGGCGKLLGWNK